ncbi:hypothetical protein MPUL_06790 [Mycolicibacterium pulveris]|uniref:Uncharacterized protein n=1 Tax=Mycolicibacterium pulveris TaxID=36813 RepID=A0A7I7UF80_MYCPV|nr:hypothetical protein MPUL_06790 [Mycolicibacterium pulveris]
MLSEPPSNSPTNTADDGNAAAAAISAAADTAHINRPFEAGAADRDHHNRPATTRRHPNGPSRRLANRLLRTASFTA